MNRIKGLTLNVGVTALAVIGVACSSGPEPAHTPTETSATSVASPGPVRPTGPSHGSSPPRPFSPGPSLKFEGVEYVHSGHAEIAEGAQAFLIGGSEIQVDSLELVGHTTEGNTAGIQDGLQVYRHKARETNEVYTFRQGEDHLNLEDGQLFKGRGGWTYWTAANLAGPS